MIDVTGTPFSQDGTTITYTFNELTPVLTQADALKAQLIEDVKNAIYSKISMLWFMTKDIDKLVEYFSGKYELLSKDIERNLYLLHD